MIRLPGWHTGVDEVGEQRYRRLVQLVADRHLLHDGEVGASGRVGADLLDVVSAASYGQLVDGFPQLTQLWFGDDQYLLAQSPEFPRRDGKTGPRVPVARRRPRNVGSGRREHQQFVEIGAPVVDRGGGEQHHLRSLALVGDEPLQSLAGLTSWIAQVMCLIADDH